MPRTSRHERCWRLRLNLGIHAEEVAVGVVEVEVLDDVLDSLELPDENAQGSQAGVFVSRVLDTEADNDLGSGPRDRVSTKLKPDRAELELDHSLDRFEIGSIEVEDALVPRDAALEIAARHTDGDALDLHHRILTLQPLYERHVSPDRELAAAHYRQPSHGFRIAA